MNLRVQKGLIFLALFLSLAESLASARNVEVYRAPFPARDPTWSVSAAFKTGEFSANEGRAWIEVNISRTIFDGENSNESYAVNQNIPELEYDLKNKQIIFKNYGKPPVICAHIFNQNFLFFKKTSIESTGKCNFSMKQSNDTVASVALEVED